MAAVSRMPSFWSFPLAILDVLRHMGFGLCNIMLPVRTISQREKGFGLMRTLFQNESSPDLTMGGPITPVFAANNVLQAAKHIPLYSMIDSDPKLGET